MHYTIVVPAHNEASNLEASLTRFIENLPVELAPILKEIIVVENGSTDDTLQVCRRLESHFPDLIRVAAIQRGSYGEAIKLGMLQSKGTHLSILECDFLNPNFVVRSIAMFESGKADVIVGSKRHPESRDRRPLKRRALTLLYNLIFLRLFFGYPGTDTHGLKSMEADCAKKLCLTALTTDEVFQTEIVLLGWRLGFRVDEIPVDISELRPSPVKVLRRVPKVLNTVWELRRSLSRFSAQSSRLDLATVPAKKPGVAGNI
jgi:glycosyltransferase involved in cell wall biosynthesis